LAAKLLQEFLALLVGLEGVGVRDVVHVEARRDEAHREVAQRHHSDLVDEDVDQGCAHVRRRLVKLEKAAVVALGKRVAHLERVFERRLLLFVGGELFEHAARFGLQFTENKVQKLISKKFNTVTFET